MNLKDEYQDGQGRSYKPILYTESYVFLRCDHYGSISSKMCRVDKSGEVQFNRAAYNFTAGTHDPTLWLQQNSESLPQKYIPESTRKVLDEHGICPGCSANELQEFNLKRLADSKQSMNDKIAEEKRLQQEGEQS